MSKKWVGQVVWTLAAQRDPAAQGLAAVGEHGVMTRATTPAVRCRVAALLGVAVLTFGVGACSSASPTIEPSGVDELTVPLVLPVPDEFVEDVDNPWLALASAPGPVIAGVATTEVVVPDGVDYYAQDARGNVWWFGREGVWTVGQDGAAAGLVITATPRLGDGYQAALAPASGVDLVAEVVGDDVEVTVGTTTYANCVVIETLDRTTGLVERAWYAEGTGQVQVQTLIVD